MAVTLADGVELSDQLDGLEGPEGYMCVIGFGSLLSERSTRFTFPDLQNFRLASIRGYRRVFGHVAARFLARGISRLETKEMASLCVEPAEPESEVLVSLFEVPRTPEATAAWVHRENEFRYLAVQPYTPAGDPEPHLAVVCTRFNDEEYKAKRCPPDRFHERYLVHGVDRVWRDDILPNRIYLRHCVLAAKSLGDKAHENFLDSTFLPDRLTNMRQYLAAHPEILEELPPAQYADKYNG